MRECLRRGLKGLDRTPYRHLQKSKAVEEEERMGMCSRHARTSWEKFIRYTRHAGPYVFVGASTHESTQTRAHSHIHTRTRTTAKYHLEKDKFFPETYLDGIGEDSGVCAW